MESELKKYKNNFVDEYNFCSYFFIIMLHSKFYINSSNRNLKNSENKVGTDWPTDEGKNSNKDYISDLPVGD